MRKLFIAISALLLSYSANAQWKVDYSHSSIKFSIRHMLVSDVEGSFRDFTGTVEFEKEDFSDLKANFTVQTNSIFTNNEKRDAHLNSPDYFDSEKYPVITLSSSSFTKEVDYKYVLKGQLNLHGVTKEVTWDVKASGIIKDPYGNGRAGFKATTVIKRSDFGIAPSSPNVVISDEVEITVNLEIVNKQK